VFPQDKMEYYCELIAAIKVRTSTGQPQETNDRKFCSETGFDALV